MRDIAHKPVARTGEEVLKFLDRKTGRMQPWSLNGSHYDVEIIFVDSGGMNAAAYERPLSRIGQVTRRREYLGEFYVRVEEEATRELMMDQLVCALDARKHMHSLQVDRVRNAFEALRRMADALEGVEGTEEPADTAGIAPSPGP